MRLADTEYVLLLGIHHIVFDGWSYTVFWRELSVNYPACSAGKPSPLPALSLQYADFAHWQQQWLQGDRLVTHLAYWRQQLTNVALRECHGPYANQPSRTGCPAPILVFSVVLVQALQTLSHHRCNVTKS